MSLSLDPIRVMTVGTSDIVIGQVIKTLKDERRFEVMAPAEDGISAVSALRRVHVDVIFVDIGDPDVEWPVTLTRLLKIDPQAKIVLVSTLTPANSRRGTDGLVRGAAEYIQTPAPHTATHSRRGDEGAFLEEVRTLAIALGKARKDEGERKIEAPKLSSITPPNRLRPGDPIVLRNTPASGFDALAIASSTGGPQALFKLFDGLKQPFKAPVFVTQHMPATFTKALADHITKRTGWSCQEATDQMTVQPGNAYIAPGDWHMVPQGTRMSATITLNQGVPENYCRPSVEPMLRGLIKVYGAKRVLLVVLTGMGADGKTTGIELANAGGTVIAQDYDTSVVWGMPGAVASAGICSAVLPIDQIAGFVAERARLP